MAAEEEKMDYAEEIHEDFSLVRVTEYRKEKIERNHCDIYCIRRGHRHGIKPEKLSVWAERSQPKTLDEETSEVNN